MSAVDITFAQTVCIENWVNEYVFRWYICKQQRRVVPAGTRRFRVLNYDPARVAHSSIDVRLAFNSLRLLVTD